MPWNGSGVFNRIYSWVADRDAGLDILADRMDQDSNDIAQGMMACLTVNGETVPVANLPMNNHRHTGAAVGLADTDYATIGQIKNGGGGITGGFLPLAGGTVTGSLTVNAALTVAGFTQMQGLNSAYHTVAGTMGCHDATVNGNLHAHADSTLDGGLTVAGFTQLHGLNCAYNTITGALGCVDATINGNAAIHGDSTLSGSLHVTGTSTLGTLNAGTTTLGALSAGTTTLGPLNAGTTTLSGQLNANSQINAQNGIRPTTNNGSACGVSGQAWSACTAFAFTNVSDADQKRELAALPQVAGLVAAITPHRFRWKDNAGDRGAGVHWGFVAQEIEGVMAGAGLEFAGARHENGVSVLDYNELVPVLWKAVQELSARVQQLEAAPQTGRG